MPALLPRCETVARRSVERCFSLLKRRRSLNCITTQGINKVAVHCYLASIVMQAMSASEGTRRRVLDGV